ncbi:hypothetical protein MKZ19_19880 [Shouchella clausii]|uniref:hypothetical protein n=1 Tax=Shouchella clausii TaxID=79880 RepID=UPI0031FC5A03
MINVRNSAFWTKDYLSKSHVRKAISDIEKLYYMNSSSEVISKYHEQTINTLLKHASQSTKFYNDYKNIKDLKQMPVVNKNIIRSQQADFLSNLYNKDKLIWMTTSGSTGEPFTCYQNKEKKKRVNAEVIFFNGLAGYNVGRKLIHLRSLNLVNKKSKFNQLLQNENLIDVNQLNKEDIEKYIREMQRISKSSSSTLLGYASTYDAFAMYFNKHGMSKAKGCKINGIISTSEILFNETRETISKAFNCNSYSRYANMENGVLAQDTPNQPNTFIINEANYYIEILDMTTDEPAREGEVGRIVVTDLYNYAMPMIRYDTGDIGSLTMCRVGNVEKKAITDFGGRKIDIVFDVNGSIISPHKISVSFWSFSELKQFQFVQEASDSYKVLLVPYNEFNREKELKNTLKEIVGENAKIEIEIVSSIPSLKSGKYKYIVNQII